LASRDEQRALLDEQVLRAERLAAEYEEQCGRRWADTKAFKQRISPPLRDTLRNIRRSFQKGRPGRKPGREYLIPCDVVVRRPPDAAGNAPIESDAADLAEDAAQQAKEAVEEDVVLTDSEPLIGGADPVPRRTNDERHESSANISQAEVGAHPAVSSKTPPDDSDEDDMESSDSEDGTHHPIFADDSSLLPKRSSTAPIATMGMQDQDSLDRRPSTRGALLQVDGQVRRNSTRGSVLQTEGQPVRKSVTTLIDGRGGGRASLLSVVDPWEEKLTALRKSTLTGLQGVARSGLMRRCLECENMYKDDANFCRQCGKRRLFNQEADEVFRDCVGNRHILRAGDLVTFIARCRHFQQQHAAIPKFTNYRLTHEIEACFEQCLAEQLKEENQQNQPGNQPYTQGINVYFFELFVARCAKLMHMTGQGFLSAFRDGTVLGAGAIRDNEGGQAVKDKEEVGLTLGAKKAERKLVEFCVNCGNTFLADARFCRKCGEERAYEEGPSGGIRADFDVIVNLAKKHNLTIPEVRKKKDLFKSFDLEGKQLLTVVDFRKALQKVFGLAPDDPMPSHFVNKHWKDADTDCSGHLDFEEFLLWTVNSGDTAELRSHDGRDAEVKKFASAHHIPQPEVERILDVFDRFDENKSGAVDYKAFCDILFFQMKVRNPADVPQKTLRRYWREANRDGLPTVGWAGFVEFYFKCFEERV